MFGIVYFYNIIQGESTNDFFESFGVDFRALHYDFRSVEKAWAAATDRWRDLGGIWAGFGLDFA